MRSENVIDVGTEPHQNHRSAKNLIVMLNGFGDIPRKSVKRLEKFIDELKNVKEFGHQPPYQYFKIFNFFVPLGGQVNRIS